MRISRAPIGLALALIACGGSPRSNHSGSSAAPPGVAADTARASGGAETARSSDSAARDVVESDSAIVNVIRRYYAAIDAGDFDAAYALWRDGGRASGQTRAGFAAGFAQTEQARVTITGDVTIEGAAGSQYATVPVTVDAVLRDGRRQHFVGSYTLRRSMVDGATAEQRRWRIFAARLRAE